MVGLKKGSKGTIEKNARINTIFFGHNYTYDHLDLFCDPIFTRGKQQCAVEKSLRNQSVAHTNSLSICSNYPNTIREILLKFWKRIQIVSERKTKHLELSNYFWNIWILKFLNFGRVLQLSKNYRILGGLVKISCFL